jgi:hypothetical protein
LTEQLEDADVLISLRRAAQLSGLADSTLRRQAIAGKLCTRKVASVHLTTRQWLHEYLTAADAQTRGRRKPLPEGYVAPECTAIPDETS